MTTPGKVIIVGGGPAGAALAYLLARRGVGVTLLEKHPDFQRAFRGETLQPSGIDALGQMGLAERFEQMPQRRIATMEVFRRGRRSMRLEVGRMGLGELCLVSQPALLEMMVAEAGRYPSFALEMGTTARDLLIEEGRVCGVRADTPRGPKEFRADLVVGTDGRHSVIRKRGSFPELRLRPGFDVLWAKVPFPEGVGDRAAAWINLEPGSTTFLLPAADGALQVGFIIPKGAFPAMRTRGIDAWTEPLIARVPEAFAPHLRAHGDALGRAVLLDVICGRLTRWTAPGVLLIGDAAHPMSPVGGQGINLALRDALVTANHLCPVLGRGADPTAIDAAARCVEQERLPEIAVIQDLQQRQARLFLEPDRLAGRVLSRLLLAIVGTGFLPRFFHRRMTRFARGVTPVQLVV
jgi:2-polyprenyl-6-methoxyphenol hydroxylase-like FAD-dependent oxidoreductase